MAPFTSEPIDPMNGRAGTGAYYTIIREARRAEQPFAVWSRTGSTERAELVGRFATIKEAKECLDVDWHEAHGELLLAWAFWTKDAADA